MLLKENTDTSRNHHEKSYFSHVTKKMNLKFKEPSGVDIQSGPILASYDFEKNVFQNWYKFLSNSFRRVLQHQRRPIFFSKHMLIKFVGPEWTKPLNLLLYSQLEIQVTMDHLFKLAQ